MCGFQKRPLVDADPQNILDLPADRGSFVNEKLIRILLLLYAGIFHYPAASKHDTHGISTYFYFSASEVTTIWRYTNVYIIIIIMLHKT